MMTPMLDVVRKPALDLRRPIESAHFVGICGSGMMPLAHALLSMKAAVSGSDLDGTKAHCLAVRGARVHTGHAAEHVADAAIVVYSSAVAYDNPELEAARERGIPIVHRSDLLAWFLARRESVLVAGTHGKTTTTAMLALLMESAGMDPWAFVGGRVGRFGGNLRAGGDRFAVAEADESDGTFLKLPRRHAIVTNVEPEHLNFWQTAEAVDEGFEEFAAGVPEDGLLVMGADDEGVQRLLPRLGRRAVTYGTGRRVATYQATELELVGTGSRFTIRKGRRPVGRVAIATPGRHNIENAMAACAMALELGASFEAIDRALGDFHGVDRRFTRRTSDHGWLVIDDYGHHPTEIAATIASARRLADERHGRLHAVFQPHRYTRLSAFRERFAASFRGADQVVVTAVYGAGEPAIPGVDGESLVPLVRRMAGCPAVYIDSFEEIKNSLLQELKKDDIVLLLGAGTVTSLANLLTS